MSNLRPRNKREMAIMVRMKDLNDLGELKDLGHYHLIRETVNGNKIGGCDIATRALDKGEGYYLVPFMWFLMFHLDQFFCDFCWEHAEDLTPVSNTGVNFYSQSRDAPHGKPDR